MVKYKLKITIVLTYWGFVTAIQSLSSIILVANEDELGVAGEERLLEEENQRFRDITQGIDNALYAIADAGRLYRIDRE